MVGPGEAGMAFFGRGAGANFPTEPGFSRLWASDWRGAAPRREPRVCGKTVALESFLIRVEVMDWCMDHVFHVSM